MPRERSGSYAIGRARRRPSLTLAIRLDTSTSMNHKLHVLGVVALLLVWSAALASASDRVPTSLPADQIEVKTEITYARPGGNALKLDLARPKAGKGPWPAVVCIHGGGWVSGSRTGMVDPYARHLAIYGYVAVAPSYRLAPDHPFPAAVADVRNCVRWLRRHAREYDIDPDRIGATGLRPAATCLSCWDCVRTRIALGRTMCRKRVNRPAYRRWSTTSVRRHGRQRLAGSGRPQIPGAFPRRHVAERPEIYRQASPISYITPTIRRS